MKRLTHSGDLELLLLTWVEVLVGVGGCQEY